MGQCGQKKENGTKENNKKKEEFNIVVSYAENGISFQSIVEKILLRRMDEI